MPLAMPQASAPSCLEGECAVLQLEEPGTNFADFSTRSVMTWAPLEYPRACLSPSLPPGPPLLLRGFVG